MDRKAPTNLILKYNIALHYVYIKYIYFCSSTLFNGVLVFKYVTWEVLFVLNMILKCSKLVIYEVLYLLFWYMYAKQHKASSETELNNRESIQAYLYSANVHIWVTGNLLT